MTEPETGLDQPDDADNVTDKELNDFIDTWLADARPERYDEEDKDWMDPVIVKARAAILEYRTTDEALDDAAKRRVRSREGQAIRSTHGELRKIAQTGQPPIGWGDEGWTNNPFFVHLLALPLKIAGGRVRWGAMKPDDWRDWELENAREGDEDQARRIEARRGARLLREWTTAQGVERTDDLRPARPDSDPAA